MRPLALAALCAAALLPLAGCSFFTRSHRPVVEIERPASRPAPPDTAAAEPRTEAPSESPPRKHPSGTTQPPTPPLLPSPPDTIQAPEPEPAPVLTVRLTPEEEVTLSAQFKSDTDRATIALGVARTKALTLQQSEQLAAGDKFLKDALEARKLGELRRACTLAEKARILAEELRSAVSKQ